MEEDIVVMTNDNIGGVIPETPPVVGTVLPGTANNEGVAIPQTPIPEQPEIKQEEEKLDSPLTTEKLEQVYKQVKEFEEKEDTHNSTRPCEFCQNRDYIMSLTNKYLEQAELEEKGKVKIPFIEELAIKLKHTHETILEWSKNVAHHKEFSETVSKIKTIQRFRLLQRTLGRYNPSGAIFQLKANHGLIETEKKIMAGDSNSPMKLEVEIIEDKPE